jgi:hypothetical protein
VPSDPAASLSPHVRSILEAGILAPSADNRHCLEFDASPRRIRIFPTAAWLDDPWHKRILALISLGAVVENMMIRAGALGHLAIAHWSVAPGELSEPTRRAGAAGETAPPAAGAADPASPLVELLLEAAGTRPSPLDAAIPHRQTNRHLRFAGPALSDAELAQFRELVADVEGVTLQFLDAPTARSGLARLARIAEAERFNNRAMHDDLFSAVRFDVGWRASADEGLPPAALQIEPGMRGSFAQLRHWPLMRALTWFGVHQALGLRAAGLPIRLAPHRGVLTTTRAPEQAAVAVGRALERIWLAAESRGLALQPLTGSALLALERNPQVPRAIGDRLREGWKALTDQTPMMVFRMGRARRPEVRTTRRAVETYLKA